MKKFFLLCAVAACVGTAVQGQSNCSNPPTVSIAATATTVCEGQSVTLTASGANTYSWTNNVVNFEPFAPTVSNSYQVIGIDAMGCSDTAEIQINVLPIPNVVANSSSLNICFGESITLSASGAQSYQWNEPTITDGTAYAPQSTGTNTYVVLGTGTNGCSNTSQVVVNVRPTPSAPVLSTANVATCVNEEVDPIEAFVANGGVVWYSDASLGNQIHSGSTLPVNTQTAGMQQLYAVGAMDGCVGEASIATVDVSTGPVLDAGADRTVEVGERTFLEAVADPSIELAWEPAELLSDATLPDPEFLATGSQTFILTGTDANGCAATDEVVIAVDPALVIGNVITPNGDGSNDVWRIYPDAARATCTVRIFDGFGRLLLETSEYQNDWDGTFEGNSLPDGDYYYYLDCADTAEKGTLTIIH